MSRPLVTANDVYFPCGIGSGSITIDGPITIAPPPTFVDGCLNGCDPIQVCYTKAEGGAGVTMSGYLTAAGGFVTSPVLPAGAQLGDCAPPRDMCVLLAKPNAAGEFVCYGGEYTIQVQGPTNKIVSWSHGPNPVADPTAGLTFGVDYYLAPCGTTLVSAEDAANTTVVIPVDVNADPAVTDNLLDGSITIADACSVTVKACIPTDCPPGETPLVEVTWTDAAGNSHTQFVPPGCEETFNCLASDVTVSGLAYISATTTTSISTPQGEC